MQSKIDGTSYEIYNKHTGNKIKEFNSYTACRGCIKFALIMGVDDDLIVYANGKNITDEILNDIARGN